MEVAIDSSNTQKFTKASDSTPAELASKSIRVIWWPDMNFAIKAICSN